MKIGKKKFFFKTSGKIFVTSKMKQNPSSCSIGIWNYHLAASKSKSRIFPGPYPSPLCIFWQFVPKSVQKCDRTSHTQKRSARTHISHTFQNGFRTHTHTCDSTSHVFVFARTFATHTLWITQMNFNFEKIRWSIFGFLNFFWKVLDDSLWQVHLRGSNNHS